MNYVQDVHSAVLLGEADGKLAACADACKERFVTGEKLERLKGVASMQRGILGAEAVNAYSSAFRRGYAQQVRSDFEWMAK